MVRGASDEQALKLEPYWWEAARPLSRSGTSLPDHAEAVVVGSGYCGLSCALALARGGVAVTLLEAEGLGFGASSRSGGMVTGGQKFVVSGALDGQDPERARLVLEDAMASLSHIEALIANNALDADYRRCGRVILAESERQYGRLERWAELLRRHTGASVSLLPKARLKEEIGGEHYHGGLLIEDYGGLHPAKYQRSLVDACEREGVGLHSHAAVTHIASGGAGFHVETVRGTVTTPTVVVATNGYSGAMLPHLQRRVIPVASYIIATEPLPPALMDELSPKRRMYSDIRRNLYYFRPAPDGTRIVFGARPATHEIPLREAAPRLHRMASEIWPALADYQISHCWNGYVGMTFDHFPHIGRHEGIHYAVGCNGSGVAMMTYLGHQTALKILGRQTRPCAFDGDSFPASALYSGRPWFVPLATAYYQVRDRLEKLL